MAVYSNKAGSAANGYLSAPGDDITTECDSTGCVRVSGTSFAAPQVSGALALLMQAFPNLSGRDAVDILLRTAADLGATGTDSTYGRGGLDLARAFAPVGTSSLSPARRRDRAPDPARRRRQSSGRRSARPCGAATACAR